MNDAEQKLLDLVGSLIIELARTHARVTQADVALWLARVALGVKK